MTTVHPELTKHLNDHESEILREFVDVSGPVAAQERLAELREKYLDRKFRSKAEHKAAVSAIAHLSRVANPEPPKPEPPDPFVLVARRHKRDGNLHLAQEVIKKHGLDPTVLDVVTDVTYADRARAARDALFDRSHERIKQISDHFHIPRTQATSIFKGKLAPPTPSRVARGEPHNQEKDLMEQINREFQFDKNRPFE